MDYLKLGTTSISEENPSGEDVKYDEDFELLESEISKLTSPSASSGIDWDNVIKLAALILETKSKHILVACYLSYGLLKQRSIDGLVDGVKVLADVVENYWESLYPPKKRIKGRINAIEWWLNKVAKDLENMEALEFDNDKKADLIINLKRVDDFLNNELDDAPMFYNLIKLVDIKLIPEATEVQSTQKDKVVKEVPTPQVQKQTPTLNANEDNDFDTLVSTLNQTTGQMIQTKDYRSELFMINRAFAWLDIDELPTSEKNITMLNPPDTQEIELLTKLYDAKNYEELLWAAESRITTYLFWLDLHFYVSESLKNLNQTKASNAVYQQVNYFIEKLPNLQNLSFSDSTPFASRTTKKWLDSNVEQKETVSSENQDESSSFAQEQESDCTSAGIDALRDKMSQSTSVQEEVIYNIQICRCLIKSANNILVHTYTQKLLQTIEDYGTHRWSPKIAMQAYSVCVESLQALNDESDSELIDSLLKKAALLRPSLVDELIN